MDNFGVRQRFLILVIFRFFSSSPSKEIWAAPGLGEFASGGLAEGRVRRPSQRFHATQQIFLDAHVFFYLLRSCCQSHQRHGECDASDLTHVGRIPRPRRGTTHCTERSKTRNGTTLVFFFFRDPNLSSKVYVYVFFS